MKKPNILFVMCDQLRADAVAALGNRDVRTPHMDRLARRGIRYTSAYSTCPVCIPARYTLRTGREPYTTGLYENGSPCLPPGAPAGMEDRCGAYLARTLSRMGYRTFGIGKFHALPWNEDLGYELQLHSEELWGPEQRRGDAYARFIRDEHPEFNFLEQLHGERTEMYYMPQMSPLPAPLTVEAWAADRAVEQLCRDDPRPYFGFVSFIGPHPPCAPPIPYNRMYNPDRMGNPIRGSLDTDHMDEQIPWMNHLVWAEDINDSHARTLRARYYGEITYIDACLGRILDAVEARDDADNTLLCFFSDHGDHLGDHHAWQKESFFEAACRVPLLVSWPCRLPGDSARDDLVCLTDLFAIATGAAGALEVRDGVDVLDALTGNASPRQSLFGYYGRPGTRQWKIMVRDRQWKYIHMANGGREQLFHLAQDPCELINQAAAQPEILAWMRRAAVTHMGRHPALWPALDLEAVQPRAFPFEARPQRRIHQFDGSRGITDFIFG